MLARRAGTARAPAGAEDDADRRVLAKSADRPPYRLQDLSTGDPDAPDALDEFSWRELREIIYADRGVP